MISALPSVVLKQVSYLVFPGTSGAPYMDYLVSDRHVSVVLVARPATAKLNSFFFCRNSE